MFIEDLKTAVDSLGFKRDDLSNSTAFWLSILVAKKVLTVDEVAQLQDYLNEE